jgi:anti-sigma B factor antagonist
VSLKFNISHINGTAVLTLEGKIISLSDVTELKEYVETNFIFNEDLILDLEKLIYLNSTGINFFVRLFTRTRNNGKEMFIANMNGTVKNLFEITKLDKVFSIANSVDEALKHLEIDK